MKRTLLMVLFFALPVHPALAAGAIDSTAALVAAIRDGAEGATIEIAAGTYELAAPLEPRAGMTLRGAGMDATVITHAAGWKPSTRTLPDPEMTTKGMDTQAYLIRLQDKVANITISDLTLRGPQLHGAIYGWENQNAHLHHLRIQDTLWTGIRTFLLKNAKIHDCEFIDALMERMEELGSATQLSEEDRQRLAESVADLPQEIGEVWQVASRKLATWITDQGEPQRPWATLVACPASMSILAQSIALEPPTGDWLWETILTAMISPAVRLRTSFCVPVWQNEQVSVQPTWEEMQSVPRSSSGM